jgi:putative endonuclease
MKRRDVGIHGEKLAADFLSRQGYRILATNYRCSEGEVDIIAEDRDYLVFVEVRTRTGAQFGIPEESITPVKMGKLRAVASHYLQQNDGFSASWRIDVVVVLGWDNHVESIKHIENAVGE